MYFFFCHDTKETKSLDLKSFARKIYEACPLARPKPEHYDSICSNSIYTAPSGSLGSPPLLDMLLVLQRKEFNVAQSNQVDSSYSLAQQADYVKNDRITLRSKTQQKPTA